MMMLLCIKLHLKQHLKLTQFTRKLSNSEAELKKKELLTQKSVYSFTEKCK